MGFKLSIILGGLLVLTASGSFFYIKYLNNQVAVLKSNAIVLETEIEKQNESIKNHLAEQKRVNEQMNVLQEQNQQAMREVKEVRDKFARHDLNNLALMKPGLIERRVNAGTKKVMTDLIELTNPKQFDETVINN
jgi:hypothetical protein